MRNHPDIYIVSIPITFKDGTEYRDSENLEELQNFLALIDQENELPITSQPSPGLYMTLVQELIDAGYQQLFTVHLSSGLSGTHEAVASYLREFEDEIDIYHIDSKGATTPMEVLIRQIVKLNECGETGELIAEKVQKMADLSEIYLMVEQMDNLVKGGRVNRNIAQVGSLLNVRPVLSFQEDGSVGLYETLRTSKKVYRRWIALAKEAVKKYPDGLVIMLAHADKQGEAEELRDLLKTSIPEYQGEIKIGLLGSVISIHTGRGALGIGWTPIID